MFLHGTGSQDMSQDNMSQDTTDDEAWTRRVNSVAAVLTTEADLKAWYIAINPALREMGLSFPRALYKEMQRDLRDFDAHVSIIPALREEEIEPMIDDFFDRADAKRTGYTCRVRQLCPRAPVYVLTSTSARD